MAWNFYIAPREKVHKMTCFASIEAIFGSASRGDDDVLSDRDILIVDDDTQILNCRRQTLEDSGWSVASYTFNKLKFLCQKRSLFIQHLKNESKIIRDFEGRFRILLDEFQPKSNYNSELIENANLAQLIEFWPNTKFGALWAADVLYVSVRNFGILRLAENKKYFFSYSKILLALADEGIINHSSVPDLLRLRLAKSLYRSGEKIPVSTAASIVRRAIHGLPSDAFPRWSKGLDPLILLQNSKGLPDRSSVYSRLRNLERIYIALLAMAPSLSEQNNFTVIKKWIDNPRAYASIAVRQEESLISDMQDALNHYVRITVDGFRSETRNDDDILLKTRK